MSRAAACASAPLLAAAVLGFTSGCGDPDLDAADAGALPPDERVEVDLGAAAAAAADLAAPLADLAAPLPDLASDRGCPTGMVRIDEFCVDRYEAFTVELRDGGAEVLHSPFAALGGARV